MARTGPLLSAYTRRRISYFDWLSGGSVELISRGSAVRSRPPPPAFAPARAARHSLSRRRAKLLYRYGWQVTLKLIIGRLQLARRARVRRLHISALRAEPATESGSIPSTATKVIVT